MCQPRKWWFGLIPLAILFLVAGLWRQAGIEADLIARGNAGLSAAGHAWAKLSSDGRDATVTGEAPSPEARGAARAAADAMPGIRRVADAMSVLPEAKPFTFTAMRDGDKITLTGVAPPGDARAALGAAVKAAIPAAIVVDELKAARGAPKEFQAVTTFGLGELARLGQGTLTVSDQTLSLTGRARDLAAYDAVLGRLAAVPAGFALGKGRGPGDILPPIIKPFVFTAEKGPGGIALAGLVPSEAVRTSVLAAARQLGQPVSETLRIAEGAPAGDWAGTVSAALRELGRLESGKATLTDDKLSIVGKGSDTIAEDDIRSGLRALPQGFALANVAIESRAIRPYVFTATRGEGRLSLAGHVPDARARGEILDMARRYFEGDTIEDGLAEGIGAPADFVSVVKAGLANLSRLAPGATLTLSNVSAALKGMVPVDFAREEVSADFRREVPAAFSTSIEVVTQPLPPPVVAYDECQLLYRDALQRGAIRFRSGAAELTSESRGLLDRLAVVTLRCGSARVEIGGHTDSDGQPQANAELSRRRAEVVAAYLIRAGVAAERLEAVGYGQTVPIAPNDSPENKARNRRIEFTVK